MKTGKELEQIKLAEIRSEIIRLAKEEIVSKTVLGREIDYYVSVQRENDNDFDEAKPDYTDAVFQVETIAEENEDRKYVGLARSFLIRAGFYRVMPREEIDRCWISSGTVWNFKKNGVAYTADFSYWEVSESNNP